MPKYIRYKNRDIVVIDGQPYYKSTGESSSLPGFWLPFLYVSPTKPFNIDHIPNIHTMSRESQAIFNHNPEGWMVKKSYDPFLDKNTHMPSPPFLNKSEWCSFSLSHKLTPENPSAETPTIELFSRLFLKRDLINSMRLSGTGFFDTSGFYYSGLFWEAGLNNEERRLAQNQIRLDLKPDLILDDADKVNNWLIENGAIVAKNIAKPFPEPFEVVWKKAENSGHELTQTKAMLKYYIQAAYGGVYKSQVQKALDNLTLKTTEELVAHIRYYTIGNDFRKDPELSSILNFIEQKTLLTLDDYKYVVTCYRRYKDLPPPPSTDYSCTIM